MAQRPLRPVPSALALAFLLAHCGSRSSAGPGQRLPESNPPEASSDPQMRVCHALEAAVRAAETRCGCPSPGPNSDIVAQCQYHLFPVSEDVALDEAALTRCVADFSARLADCTTTRLPASCEPRVLANVAHDLRFDIPEGERCPTRTNGDAAYPSGFTCAVGLDCVSEICVPVGRVCEGSSTGSRACEGAARCARRGDENRCIPSLCSVGLDLPCACP